MPPRTPRPPNPRPEQLDKGADKSVALPGLATGPAKKGTLEFESTSFEKVSWSWADASGAVKEHARCLGLIASCARGSGARAQSRTTAPSAHDAINDIEKKLTAWPRRRSPLPNAQNAIKTVK